MQHLNDVSQQIRGWYQSDESKEIVYRAVLVFWSLLLTSSIVMLCILTPVLGDWGYAFFILLYIMPVTTLSMYSLLQSLRRLLLVDFRRSVEAPLPLDVNAI